MLGDGELEDVEPAGDEGLRARGDYGPGCLDADEGVEEGARAGDFGGVVAVEVR